MEPVGDMKGFLPTDGGAAVPAFVFSVVDAAGGSFVEGATNDFDAGANSDAVVKVDDVF